MLQDYFLVPSYAKPMFSYRLVRYAGHGREYGNGSRNLWATGHQLCSCHSAVSPPLLVSAPGGGQGFPSHPDLRQLIIDLLSPAVDILRASQYGRLTVPQGPAYLTCTNFSNITIRHRHRPCGQAILRLH